ncbi:MAG: protein phosphatase 2C domain-containing protein [Candidatus Competibacteraceae bacterium]|nr:protein phosphatase 2C domain-containing protein [Candidatus Competibacteraceae bacterium]
MQVHQLSLPGRGPENQDALAVVCHPQDRDLLLLALADGQGGQPGGGAAARLAVASVLESALLCSPAALMDPDRWPALLEQADRRVWETAGAGFTTLLACCLTAHRLAGAANGDGALVVVDAAQGRLLTAAVPRNPPVGCSRAAIKAFGDRLTPPWLVMAVSDGVWKYTGLDPLLGIQPDVDAPLLAHRLRERARGPGVSGLQDDFTLAIIQSRPVG